MISASLPMPPPVSALTTNKKGGGRTSSERYRIWKQAAGHALNASHPRPIVGAVEISIMLEAPRNKDGSATKVPHDCSNRVKAVEDLLVAHGLIEDDSYPTVMKTTAQWVEGMEGCFVTVHPVARYSVLSAAE